MYNFGFEYGDDADEVLLSPADAAILTFAAERLTHRFDKMTLDKIPADFERSVSSAVAWRINNLIEALRSSEPADDGENLIVHMPSFDRIFFAQVLYGYHDCAETLVLLYDRSVATDEARKERAKALYEYFGGLFTRLGGRGWTEIRPKHIK